MNEVIAQNFKKILLIQLRQMGDILLTTPALRALRQKFPTAQIAFLLDKPFEPLLRHNPDLDLLLVRDPKKSFESIQTILKVRKFGPDLVIDYLANPRTALITILSGAKFSLSYANKRRSFLYKIRAHPKGEYVAEEKLSLLEPLGIKGGEPDLVLNYPKSTEEKIDRQLKEMGISEGFLVVLDLFHKRPARQWPINYFMEIADRLSENYQAKIIITCLPQNRARAEQAISLARQKHFIAANLDLLELAALIRRSKLFLGGDAGPKHIAVSQKTPTFTILGPSGLQWTPPSPIHQTAFLDLDCRPCSERDCPKPDLPCQTRLTPDLAWQKLKLGSGLNL